MGFWSRRVTYLIIGLSAAWLLLARKLVAAEAFFDSNGIKICYSVQGQGEPVLLIHGFAVNGTTQWVLPGIVNALAKDYRVITLDNRGHGRSDKPHDPKKYGLELVEDAVRLLDHLHIRKAHVIGYSMGGLIALKLAISHPDRVASATLGAMGLFRPAREPMLAELADSLEKGRGFEPLIVWLKPPGRGKPAASQVAMVNSFLQASNDLKAVAALVRGAIDPSLDITDEELRASNVPLLAIVGDMDPLKAHVAELKKHAPRIRTVLIKDGDHFNTVFQPAFLQTLKNHLAEHPLDSHGREAADR
jgi:pimeloyl-ACP methyl ester carboxylesterase